MVKRKWLVAAVVVGIVLGWALGPALASDDEIAQQISRGLELYRQGKLTQAISELEFALAQMKQKKAGLLGGIFPPAPTGWKVEKPEGGAMGTILGGGVRASCRYIQQGGDGEASIDVLTDSPFIVTLGAMLSNPLMLQGAGAGKLVRVKGFKGLLKAEAPKHAELQLLAYGKVLINITVDGVAKAKEMALGLAEGINYAKLKKLVNQ